MMTERSEGPDDAFVCGEDTPEDEFQLTPQQEQALELGDNLVVTAGAGTGKTTTLTERYRAILTEHPELSPTQILTLTFTNDATNELRDRIRTAIDEELATASEETYDRWRGAKDELPDGYIHTIHGFCSRVLREFAVEAGVNPDFDTLDEGDAAAVIDTAITAVLDHHGVGDSSATTTREYANADHSEYITLDDDWDIHAELSTLTQLYSRSRLHDTLQSLFAERPDSTTWASRWSHESPAAYLEFLAERMPVFLSPDEANQLIQTTTAQEAIETLLTLDDRDLELPADDHGYELLTHLTEILRRTQAHTPAGDSLGRQQFLYEVATGVTTKSGTRYGQSSTRYYAGSKGTWSEHGLEQERAQLKASLDALADLIEPEDRHLDHDPVLAHTGAQVSIALARVFQVVRAEYARRKDRQGVRDYSDLITETERFLRQHTAARETLRDQFAYIMLDEVQDTDPRQSDLIRLLSGDDPDRFDGENVFVVGDEKQSIFRFRDADVEQFKQTQEALSADSQSTDDATHELTGNFRTAAPTLTTINELFEQVFQPAADGPDGSTQVDTTADTGVYEPFEAQPQRLTACRNEGTEIEGQVEYLISPADAETDAALGLADSWYTTDPFVSTAQREARAIAARLTRLFADGPQIYDPKAEEYTDIRPKHVTLLFRSTRRAAAFERAFDAIDPSIPYTNVSSGSYLETPEIRPLINLLRVFEDPYSDIPLYGVLRSPLFGFTDDTLAKTREPNTSLWESLKGATEELQSARVQLSEWRAAVGMGESAAIDRWSALLSRVIDETGYLIGIGADTRPQQAVANVEKFREQLRNWEEGSAQSVATLLNRIERERTYDDDPGEARIPKKTEGVQLRTIHSAKGLEFPVVIVPEVTRRFNMQSSITYGVFERIDDQPVLGMKAPDPRADGEMSDTGAYTFVNERYYQRERAEQRRLLYVAATRTRDHLIFSGTHKVDTDRPSGLADTGYYNGNWDEAWYWTDWLQPTLLDIEDLVSKLARDGTVKTSIEDGQYTVSRPRPPINWHSTASDQSVPTDLEISQPSTTEQPRLLSATAFRDQLATVDDRPSQLQASQLTVADLDASSTSGRIDQVDGKTIGTIVHALCELEPPRSQWESIIKRQVDAPSELSASAVDAMIDHAAVGLAGVNALEAGHDVTSRHDEISVTLDHDTVRITGAIDHLTVTEDGYLVIDYKTDTLETAAVDEVSEYYLTQLLAYAGALIHDDDTAIQVTIALIFTETGQVLSTTLTEAEINELLSWAVTQLSSTPKT